MKGEKKRKGLGDTLTDDPESLGLTGPSSTDGSQG